MLLTNAWVPLCCLQPADRDQGLEVCIDELARVDLEIRDGKVAGVYPAGAGAGQRGCRWSASLMDLRGKMVLPTFADLHTHIDKGHTCERSRNPDGSLSGADRSTASDAAFWDAEDVYRRMDFSLQCAYAHGTSALRTHLINMSDKQTVRGSDGRASLGRWGGWRAESRGGWPPVCCPRARAHMPGPSSPMPPHPPARTHPAPPSRRPLLQELTWPVFSALKRKWTGKVELQGVSLVTLSHFRDLEAATRLADTVAAHGGLLGAAVCCAERGGCPDDDWTTCEQDRGQLLDRIFTLAKERDLDIDFHTDENGNELARGLRYVAEKAIEHGYEGRVVCGHCWCVRGAGV